MPQECVQLSVQETAARILAEGRLPLSQKIDRCLEILRRHAGAERVSIAVLGRGGKSLWVRYSPQAKILGAKIPIHSNQVAAVAFRSGKPLLINDLEASAGFESIGEYRSNSCLCIPVSVHGKTIAVINFTDRSDGKYFTEKDQEEISELADSLGIFLNNARLLHHIKDDQKRLSQKNRDLKQLLEWKMEVVQMIVHDLKTPINEVVANLDMIRDEAMSPSSAECLDTALVGCDHLMRMVTNLLDVAKMSAHKIAFQSRQQDICELVQKLLEKIRPLAAVNNVTLEQHWVDQPMMAEIDESLIERAVINLIDNATKFSPEGGTVEITGRTEGRFHVIDVRDEGPGIAEDLQKSIFQSYVQGPAPQGTIRGFGLGLPMAKMAVQRHGGKIVVRSQLGWGSTFSVYLPAERYPEETE